MNICAVSSARIAYKIYGESSSSGATIVIDTGIASCSAEWWAVAERLKSICPCPCI